MNKMTGEQAKEIRHSTVWGYVLNELDYKLMVLDRRLRHCTKDELAEIQDKMNLLEEIKRLPDDVIHREAPESELP